MAQKKKPKEPTHVWLVLDNKSVPVGFGDTRRDAKDIVDFYNDAYLIRKYIPAPPKKTPLRKKP